MISALHLIWIIPLVAVLGFMLGAVMAVSKRVVITDKHKQQ